MIGKVHKRGSDLPGLLWYLYGSGRRNEHVGPHLVGGWRHPDELEPPVRDGRRDFTMLTSLMEVPLAILGGHAPDKHVYHLSLRAAETDPELGDGAWMDIAATIMDRTGLSPRGEEHRACPWAAVHHGDNHIHIVTVLGRLDGRSTGGLHNDYYRIGEAIREIEEEYGLEPSPSRDRTADRRPTPAEISKAKAAGRDEATRVTLCRHARAARAASMSEAEFFEHLDQHGVRVKLTRSPVPPRKIVGYSVGLKDDHAAGGRQVWYPGRDLAADLTLAKLRHHWPPEPEPQPRRRPSGRREQRARDTEPPRRPGASPRARLSGTAMNPGAARAALRCQVSAVTRSTSGEDEFFDALADAGLLVRFHRDPAAPRGVSGYAVSLPGLLHHADHRQLWFGGSKLDAALSLPVLRRNWAAGQEAAPNAGQVKDGESADICDYAAAAARESATELPRARGRDAADIIWATSDLLTATAETSGEADLRRAADGFARASRSPWGRIPAPSDHGQMLRTAAWLLSRAMPCNSEDPRDRAARAALVKALAGLARAVAVRRAAQNRLLQAEAAYKAATGLEAARVSITAETSPKKKAQIRHRTDRTARHSGPSL